VPKPLPLRIDAPPDDTVVIIRAGVMTEENVRVSADRAFQYHGLYAISVEAVIDSSLEETCRNSDRIGDLYKRIHCRPLDGCEPTASRCWPHMNTPTSASC
jgi:hypothetical protein